MENEFDWVPFYKEMAEKLLSYHEQQNELLALLKKIGVNGLTDEYPKGKNTQLNEIDPFTFTALIVKHSDARRIEILSEIKKTLQIQAEVPTSFAGVPNADPRQTWLFPYKYHRDKNDVNKLWNLFEEVVRHGKITEDVFVAAMGVKYAGRAKLTQAIFRASPERFFPVDGQTTSYLARLGLPNKFKSAKDYENICTQVKNKIAKPLYVQSHDAWQANQTPLTEEKYQQAALNKASKNNKFKEPDGEIPPPQKTTNGASTKYQRNIAVAADALQRANFKCEINPNHETFISSVKDKPYVEAHHLIPFSKQSEFRISIDVTANVIALCPNCHRLLHHGKASDKETPLVKLLKERNKRLKEKGIQVDSKSLLNYYQGGILDEDV